MAQAQLRIFRGPETELPVASPENEVTISVGEVLPLLGDALEQKRTWLNDFEDDNITISSDLYEVLLAYRFFRRPSA